MSSQPSENLQNFENPRPGRNYTIRIEIPEFTCLCPMTGQPDFAELTLEYVPDKLCVELKSLKLYMWTFRERGAFHEAVTNEILDHIVSVIQPNFIRLTAIFNVRGGIYTSVIAEYRQPDWSAPERVQLP
jgi:7-cyano-7-deazaguanine reductase